MIVWNTMWFLLVISKLIVSVRNDFDVDVYDFLIWFGEGEDWNENDPDYIRFLNSRNRRAKRLGIPLRGTRSADEMGIGDKVEIYCEPGCVRTEIWKESNLWKHTNSNELFKKPDPVPAPAPSVPAPCTICFPSAFMCVAPPNYCVPFDNPELKEYLDGELKKIMDRVIELIETKMKTKVPDTPETTLTADSHSNIGKDYAEPKIICEDKEGVYFGPVPGNCTAYYLCAFGDIHLHTCGNGMLFCSTTLKCVDKESARCV